MHSVTLNVDKGVFFAEPLDTWLTAGSHDHAVPEASGSSARVFRFKYPKLMKTLGRDTAIKVMRHDKVSYAAPLFQEEIKILQVMAGQPGMTNLIYAGFLQASPETIWPEELAP